MSPFQGAMLEQVKTYKYLGVMMSSEGSFKDELNELTEKNGNMFRAIKNGVLKGRNISQNKSGEVKRIVKQISNITIRE